MNSIEAVMQDVDARIGQLQELRGSLERCLPLMGPQSAATKNGATPPLRVKGKSVRGGETPKRKYTRRVGASAPAASAKPPKGGVPGGVTGVTDERPATIGAAMKQVARRLKKFTRAELVAGLDADPHTAQIRAEASDAAIAFNLKYWSEKSGKLRLDGDVYTVVDLEF